MYKNKIYVLICLSMLAPILSLGGALDRYTVPQQKSGHAIQTPGTVSESVYIDFMKETSNYSRAKKEEMKAYYHKKLKEAVREKNFEAAMHYERLIGILNSN